jgi:hypothetical protein
MMLLFRLLDLPGIWLAFPSELIIASKPSGVD